MNNDDDLDALIDDISYDYWLEEAERIAQRMLWENAANWERIRLMYKVATWEN